MFWPFLFLRIYPEYGLQDVVCNMVSALAAVFKVQH